VLAKREPDRRPICSSLGPAAAAADRAGFDTGYEMESLAALRRASDGCMRIGGAPMPITRPPRTGGGRGRIPLQHRAGTGQCTQLLQGEVRRCGLRSPTSTAKTLRQALIPVLPGNKRACVEPNCRGTSAGPAGFLEPARVDQHSN